MANGGKWIDGNCTRVKRVTSMRGFACNKHEDNGGSLMAQREQNCDEVESVTDFTYLADRVIVG